FVPTLRPADMPPGQRERRVDRPEGRRYISRRSKQSKRLTRGGRTKRRGSRKAEPVAGSHERPQGRTGIRSPRKGRKIRKRRLRRERRKASRVGCPPPGGSRKAEPGRQGGR